MPRQRDIAALAPGTQLRLLMVYWRRRLRPGELPTRAGHRRRSKHASQEDVARAAKVATRWYATLERGELENVFSTDLLDRVADVLHLDHEERRVLFLLASGIEPPPQTPTAPATIGPEVQAVLDCFPWPAYITDETWELLAFNRATLAWFPYLAAETNIMRWFFCNPAARETLIDWENVHAPLMLAQLRGQYARTPEAPALLELIADILSANQHAEDLWTSRPVVSLEKFAEPRQLYVAGSEVPTTARVVSFMPVVRPEVRVTIVVPVSGHIPPSCVSFAPQLPATSATNAVNP